MKCAISSSIVTLLVGCAVCAAQQKFATPNPVEINFSESHSAANIPEEMGLAAPSFSKDVLPLLKTYCIECHNEKVAKSGFNFEDYEQLMKGGKKNPAIIPGEPDKSLLIRTMALDNGAKKKMPPVDEKQPSAKDIDKLKAWIAAGAKDDSDNDAPPH